MRKIFRQLCTWMLIFVMVFSIMPIQALADDISVPSTVTITRYSAKDRNAKTGATFNKQYFTYVPGKITNLKSNKTSVVKVSKTENTYSGTTSTSIYLTAKKAGTATVSFKYNGKTYKTKVTVKKYTNPVSSITIGSTKLSSSKFSSKSAVTLSYSKYAGKKVKVKATLKSGWKVSEEGWSGYIEYLQNGWMKSEMLKNGKSLTISGGSGFFIRIPAYNSSTGQQENIYIYFI